MLSAPLPKFGPFKVVQPSHLRAVALTQEQRQTQAKQVARCAAVANLLVRRELAAEPRRFTGDPITEIGGLS